MENDDERRFAADEYDHPERWTPGPDVTPELFREWRSPRAGAANPEILTNPVWQWLVRTRIDAYRANRRDGRDNHLRDFDHAVFWRDARRERGIDEPLTEDAITAFTARFGAPPDLDLAERLYRPAVPHEAMPPVDGEYFVRRVRVEGVTLRFTTDSWSVRLVIEGDLPKGVVELVVGDLRDKLERLGRCEWTSQRL
jgi:hypothetical protein